MAIGSGLEVESARPSERAPEASEETSPHGAGPGTLQLQALLARGLPNPQIVAQTLARHPAEQRAMLTLLHGAGGNGYVQSVVNALGTTAYTAPIRLNPNAPPAPPTSPLPNARADDLEARAQKSQAQDLLKSTDLASGENARQAMEILISIDDAHRGKMLDELDDQAFENLLDRVPDHERERFAKLVAASHKPKRKLLLWAASHKARAENDIARYKGDAGRDAPLYKTTDEEGADGWEADEVEKEQIEAGYTRAQQLNRRRHERRVAAVDTTKQEVDAEVARLSKKADKGSLTLADVDELTERKDLEYQIELENNLSLTASGVDDKGTEAKWSKAELESVRMTLARLPHVRNPDAFETLERRPYQKNWMDGVGGETFGGDEIRIYNWGTTTSPGFRHGGDKREMVSDEFRRAHGDTIGSQEFVLTHEVGHDVAHQNPKALAALTKAAGWDRVKAADLEKDGVSDADIARLEARRDNPNEGGGADIGGTLDTYAPIAGSDEYWALPRTAVPAQTEASPGSKGDDAWMYARVNPDEQFAEIYAKAVHVPEKLHDELVDRPAAAAHDAQQSVAEVQKQIDDLRAGATGDKADPKLAVLTKRLAALKDEATRKETAKRQRAEEFRIMREDVFHTDKAVVIAFEHLKAKKVSAAKLAEFERRAAIASTPEQIAFLEREALE